MNYRFKSLTTILLSAAALMVASTLFTSHSSDKKNDRLYSEIPYCAVSPTVPKHITFAGKSIDLTPQDRHERLDREILAFTYAHINTMLQIKRANRLFPIVEPILKECGVPDDFKYLMIIESNGDIYARSNVGAAGLWQFMEKTGREYGLEVNKEVDERYHIEKATRAACKYLKKSYEEFGNWITVAASYNAGVTNIRERVEKQKESDAMNITLVPETSRYIFRLLAAKTIFSDPVGYGFLLKESDLYPPLPIAQKKHINGGIKDLPDFAKKYGLNYMHLREANPWLRCTTLTNQQKKRYTILIPDANALRYDPKETKAHNPKWVIR
ncbi:MAG: lytic transglycosylase domain-containing protein [Bacteroidaceae bacterium]|nr:lytic transglycosylase domain-containing protein [Bacteroidaceae bacterium]